MSRSQFRLQSGQTYLLLESFSLSVPVNLCPHLLQVCVAARLGSILNKAPDRFLDLYSKYVLKVYHDDIANLSGLYVSFLIESVLQSSQ